MFVANTELKFDLPGQLDCFIKLFADDAKLYVQYSPVPRTGEESAKEPGRGGGLGPTLEYVFNHKKCKHLQIGNKTEKSSPYLHNAIQWRNTQS